MSQGVVLIQLHSTIANPFFAFSVLSLTSSIDSFFLSFFYLFFLSFSVCSKYIYLLRFLLSLGSCDGIYFSPVFRMTLKNIFRSSMSLVVANSQQYSRIEVVVTGLVASMIFNRFAIESGKRFSRSPNRYVCIFTDLATNI